MKEQFLQLIWKQKLFNHSNLTLSNGKSLLLKNYGTFNSHESGPDFFNARIAIDGLWWSGNIEIHIKSSDWYKHNHQVDSAYNNVILHVVWENDFPVEINGWEIPVLILNDRVDPKLLLNLTRFQKSLANFPCQQLIGSIEPIYLRQMMDSSLFLRLERKSSFISDMDVKQLAYLLFAKAIGGKVNQFSFEYLAQNLPFSFLEHLSYPQRKLTIASHNGLNLSGGYHDSGVQIKFKRKGMRPSSFPEKRLKQLGNLIPLIPVFCNMIELPPEELIFHFRKEVQKLDNSISYDTQNLLLINAVVPFLFIQGKFAAFDYLQQKAMDILQLLPPEKNNCVAKMRSIGFKVNNSFDSQAILEIYNEFCSNKKCMQCSVGFKILQQ